MAVMIRVCTLLALTMVAGCGMPSPGLGIRNDSTLALVFRISYEDPVRDYLVPSGSSVMIPLGSSVPAGSRLTILYEDCALLGGMDVPLAAGRHLEVTADGRLGVVEGGLPTNGPAQLTSSCEGVEPAPPDD